VTADPDALSFAIRYGTDPEAVALAATRLSNYADERYQPWSLSTVFLRSPTLPSPQVPLPKKWVEDQISRGTSIAPWALKYCNDPEVLIQAADPAASLDIRQVLVGHQSLPFVALERLFAAGYEDYDAPTRNALILRYYRHLAVDEKAQALLSGDSPLINDRFETEQVLIAKQEAGDTSFRDLLIAAAAKRGTLWLLDEIVCPKENSPFAGCVVDLGALLDLCPGSATSRVLTRVLEIANSSDGLPAAFITARLADHLLVMDQSQVSLPQLPADRFTKEALDLVMSSDIWWLAVDLSSLSPLQFQRFLSGRVGSTDPDYDTVLARLSSAPREYVVNALKAASSLPTPLTTLSPAAMKVVTDAATSPSDELFALLVSNCDHLMLRQYVVGLWRAHHQVVVPPIDQLPEVIAQIAASSPPGTPVQGSLATLPVDAVRNGVSRAYALAFLEVTPGAAAYVVRQHPHSAEFAPYIAGRLISTGAPFEYALSQLLEHPETSLSSIIEVLSRLGQKAQVAPVKNSAQ
jgi:hypothetical protein